MYSSLTSSLRSTDAAELDAVDDFLNVMVDLSFIEDREERGRSDLARVTPKRWEAKVNTHCHHIEIT